MQAWQQYPEIAADGTTTATSSIHTLTVFHLTPPPKLFFISPSLKYIFCLRVPLPEHAIVSLFSSILLLCIVVPTYLYQYKSLHTYIHTYIHTHVHTCIHTYLHTYTHIRTCIHTYIHTYIHTCVHAFSRLWEACSLAMCSGRVFIDFYIYFCNPFL